MMALLSKDEIRQTVQAVLPLLDVLSQCPERLPEPTKTRLFRVAHGAMMALTDDEVRSLEVLMLTGRDGEAYDQEGYDLLPWAGKEEAIDYLLEKYPLPDYLRRGLGRMG